MRVQLWRFLLTLSLLLTLPMQAYAAARMASCDAVLAGALADVQHGAVQVTGLHGGGMQQGASRVGEHEASHYGAHDASHHGAHIASHVGGHDASLGGGHDASQGLAHDGGPGASHASHGTSCMSCTPCSPGAALTCVVPVSSTFQSARVVPALLVAPTSADLAHPERPPQSFLA